MPRQLTTELPNGAAVGYAEAGPRDGTPVMYVHGTPSSRLEMGPETDAAAERLGARVIAPDRPGIGLSTFRPYSVASYPNALAAFADRLGVKTFSIIAVSGGGRYGYACAAKMPDRVERLVTVSSTCSFDLPGAKATWTTQDRRAYVLARRAPWLFELFLWNLKRRLDRGDAVALYSMYPESYFGLRDREAFERPSVRETIVEMVRESLRQGPRGVAHDYRLEATAWGVPLRHVRVPVEIWHGGDDRVVSPDQGKLLLEAVPTAEGRFLAEEGHISLIVNRFGEILARCLPR